MKMTKTEMLQGANNQQKRLEMKLSKNKELLQNELIKKHVLANLQQFVKIKEEMKPNQKKLELEQQFKELVKVAKGIDFILDDTEKFLKMIQ